MIESVTVYGFGSFFNGKGQPSDIDLLLIHRSTDVSSCKFAIECKTRLKSALPSADIVVLSKAEAESFNFIARANAIKLNSVYAKSVGADVKAITDRLLESRAALKFRGHDI